MAEDVLQKLEPDCKLPSSTRSTRRPSWSSPPDVPGLPNAVIITHVFPFLDRLSWNRLSASCQEIHKAARAQTEPWPERAVIKYVVCSLTFSPRSDTIACGCHDAAIRIYGRQKGLWNVLRGHVQSVISIAYSPDGSILASGDNYSTIRLWNVMEAYAYVAQISSLTAVLSLAFSPNGTMIASGGWGTWIRLWRIADVALVRSREVNKHWSGPMCFSPDGNTIAFPDLSNQIRLWNLFDDENDVYLQGHSDSVNAVVYSPDGTYIASGGDDQTIRIWNTIHLTCDRVIRCHTSSITLIAFSPDCKTVASVSNDVVIMWVAATGTVLQKLENQSKILSIRYAPDGRTFSSASYNGRARLWRL